jgi:hypothetical protein
MIYVLCLIGLLMVGFWMSLPKDTPEILDTIFRSYYKPESFHWQTREETYADWRKKHKKVYELRHENGSK